jgi:hypothetical protein
MGMTSDLLPTPTFHTDNQNESQNKMENVLQSRATNQKEKNKSLNITLASKNSPLVLVYPVFLLLDYIEYLLLIKKSNGCICNEANKNLDRKSNK